MVTLEELVKKQKLNGMSDISVIRTFFTLNDMEEEGLDLIYELTRFTIEKLKHRQKIIEEWTSYLPSKYLYENYDLDIADWLHTLELDFITNGCELSESRFEWAKENIPNIVRPQLYFNPLVDWLKDKGIEFMAR